MLCIWATQETGGSGWNSDKPSRIWRLSTQGAVSLFVNRSLLLMENRTVLFHYHLFKNAGTSVDAILSKSFDARWEAREFTESIADIPMSVSRWIESTPNLIAYSSHTALFPTPEIVGVNVIPIVFFRHPLLRVYSSYVFERQQKVDTFGSKLAARTDFEGYLKLRLARKNDASAKNFQGSRLARVFPSSHGSLHQRACDSLGVLPFIGLVEDFRNSIYLLNKLCVAENLILAREKMHENRSVYLEGKVEDRVKFVSKKLSASLLAEFKSANETDYSIHQTLTKRYAFVEKKRRYWARKKISTKSSGKNTLVS